MNKKKVIISLLALLGLSGIGFCTYKAVETHPVAYDLDGGTMVTKNPVTTVKWLDDAKAPEAKKEHYVFKGWTDGNEVMTSIKHARNDVSLKAVFSPEVYTISIKNGDGEISRTTYAYGSAVDEKQLAKFAEADFKKHPYENFAGYTDEQGTKVKDIKATDSGNKTLTTSYDGKEYSINYELDGGSTDNPATYKYGAGVDSLSDPSLSGYNFTGWYSDEGHTSKVESIAKDQHGNVTLYAAWEKIPVVTTPRRSSTRRSYNYSSGNASSGGSTASYSAPSGNYISIPAIGYTMTLTDDGGFESPSIANIDWNWIYQYDEDTADYLSMPLVEDHAYQGLSHLGERCPVGSQIIIG